MRQYRIVTVYGGYAIEVLSAKFPARLPSWSRYRSDTYMWLWWAKWVVKSAILDDQYRDARWNHKSKVVWGPHP